MKVRVTRSVVPNLLTLGNLFSGFLAIINIAGGNHKNAMMFFIAALLFDMFDGMAARLIGATSDLGAELDSLCDVVSFGVVPSYLLYSVFFFQHGSIGMLIAALPALLGAIRLARFNILLTSFDDKSYFRGLPIPASAITIFSYVMFMYGKGIIPAAWQNPIIVILAILIPLAMISNIKFDNIPRPNATDFKTRPIFSIFFFLGVFASIYTKGTGIFLFMVVYIVQAAIRYFIFSMRNIHSIEDEIDEE